MKSIVRIRKRFQWAVLPTREQPTREVLQPTEDMFRWGVEGRAKYKCGPYQLGRILGYHLRSPLTVIMEPLSEYQFRCERDRLDEVSHELGIKEVWERDGTFIGFKDPTFLKRYQFRNADHWEAMFLPNGQNTVEWRLGLDIELPEEYGLLICPPNDPIDGFEVPYGFMGPRVASKLVEQAGLSIAFRPTRSISVYRGDIIAKAIPIPSAVFKLETEMQESGC